MLVAETMDGPLARTSVATGLVRLGGDPARLTRLRPLLWITATALLAWALIAEGLRWRTADA